MSRRGRGTLEVKPSKNPFYQTTNSLLGLDLEEEKEFEAPKVARKARESKRLEDKYNFEFLYERESNNVGKEVEFKRSKLSETLTENETKAQQAVKRSNGLNPDFDEEAPEEMDVVMGRIKEISVDKFLNEFKHEAKKEHPMYTTSSNEVGKRQPSAATITVHRRARPQAFSTSFNGFNFRDQSLNTSMTHSKVHKALDPQFI